MISYDPRRSVYYNENIEYLFDTDIYEMDIHDAGFSIIKQFNLLPDDKIAELEKMHKGIRRHIAIGKLQRDDKAFSNALSDKFTEVRRAFIEFNRINDNELLAVKKDALFVLRPCERTQFGLIEFATKHKYTSYIRFVNVHNMELYYSEEGIDVKGMNDNSVNKHRIYLLEFIKGYIQMMEEHDTRVRRRLMNFIDKYKAGELEEEYYLEFNNRSADINPVFNFREILVPLAQITLKEAIQ